ncbi:MAG: TauD/TfdA family dioxygenase, partial [Rhodospirillales bacterium]|nr:TauD/TfdA family dioxygenase [Rhodospirillales bacterium]
MTVTVTPLNQTETGDFAAELSGIDLKKPIAGEDGEAVQGALWQYAVIVFHDQHLDDETQFTFSRIFGELEIAGIRPEMKRETDNPHFSDLSNIDGDGHILPADNEKMMFQRGNRLWHTDSSFKPIPAGPSILTGRTLPPLGGDTQFADMRASFD